MTAPPLNHLGAMPVSEFLRDYWQQKPLFIPNAIPGWEAPLDGNDLAGLALEHSVESRLIIEKTSKDPLCSQWAMEHGPLAEERFDTLPSSHFTLLIQALDQICPELHQLLNQFRFIPNWRIDDIMASVAPTGGSVGPHFDYYDVFLLQATGTRRWQLGQQCSSASPLVPDCPLKILTAFESQAEYIATPGDLLYIPANMAHWGVAQSDDCTTYSIGFRSPSYSDILLDLSQDIASTLSPDTRYRDPALNPFGSQDCGEISPAVAQTIAEHCQSYFTPERVAAWLGKSLTESKRCAPDVTTAEFDTDGLILAADVRAAYTQNKQGHSSEPLTSQNVHGNTNANAKCATVFINGDQWQTSLSLARALCNYTIIQPEHYCSEDQAIIEQWIDHEYLNLPDAAHASTHC
ncbi:cupin domain-containing protein [Marinagarivorans cellulosilyticus]|uniref:50S ribosomal protein L16 3-hydroxylase n=1 Tax=Marinagarivorans cellulosilyticus TaxID=2721545 RepID=A0AAN1WJS0_9GAMM|nr:cupin domain-containing protein [Marinagarivorans cellulosilyticus]BCD98874.1 50S ribosomal protein L16 3-hydroxylase [Marinagarivorans cellulosilyticus]